MLTFWVFPYHFPRKSKTVNFNQTTNLNFREKNTTTPIVVVPSSYNHIKEEELIEWGANIVIYANHLLRASFPSMQNVAKTMLKNKRTSELDNTCMSIKEILELIPGTK